MTAEPLTRDDTRWDRQATFDALAFGLTDPVRVIVPPDGDWRWREPCSVCHQTRAECSAWEAHAIQRRQAYAEQTNTPYDLWRCGRCGGPVGADAVQTSGLRYCSEAHAEPLTVPVLVHDGAVFLPGDVVNDSGDRTVVFSGGAR